ncbi:hypothetical protein [Subtercola sp. RTI3]|uniref:hypothetical protein n=1 Tax=Subtercola sp. RTI3 TaxID=3048639 RepID=UPI002B225EC7|nr:hypothetical protein [Subtercola sp. RTI3]MEA9985463.1 hypothetical protein [Subtercola sp. RTI3]
MTFHRFVDDDEFWQRVSVSDDAFRESFARLPMFGVAGWPALQIGEWMFAGGHRSLVFTSPVRGDVSAHATTQDHATATAGATVTVHLDDHRDAREFRTQLSRRAEAFTHRGHASYEPVDPLAAVPDDLLTLLVDTTPVTFETWYSHADRGGVWWASGTLGPHAIVVESSGPLTEALRLDRLHDPEPLVTAHHTVIGAARAAALASPPSP